MDVSRRRLAALLTASLAAVLRRIGESLGSKSGLRSAAGLASGAVRVLAFWAAVLLPLVHVALLLGGLDTPTRLAAFGVLMGSNLLALVVGHQYAAR